MNTPVASALKLSQTTAIYIYHFLPTNLHIFLIIDYHWAAQHPQALRQFFITCCQGAGTLLVNLQTALTHLQTDRAIGIINQSATIYVAVFGLTEIWLIRQAQITNLLHGESNQLVHASGWLQPNDTIVGLLGTYALSTTQTQLQPLTASLQAGEQPPFTNIFSGGFLYWPIPSTVPLSFAKQSIPILSDPSSFTAKYTAFINLVNRSKSRLQIHLTPFLDRLSIGLQSLISKLPGDRTIYAIEARATQSAAQRWHRRWLLALAVLMLITLAGSVSYGLHQRRSLAWQQRFGQLLTETSRKLTEGQQLAQLNPLRAREIAGEAEQIMQTLEQRGLPIDQLQHLRQQLGTVLGLASGKQSVQFNTWLSLNLVRADLQGHDLATFANDLYILDSQADRVIKLGLSDKSPKILAGKEQLGETSRLAAFGEFIYILTDQGIIKLDESTAQRVVDQDPEWGRVSDLQVFAGNLYLLGQSGIWKYPVTDTGFGSKQAWLTDSSISVDQTVSLTIDGFIWTAQPQEIRKFAQNQEDPFTISDVPETFQNIKTVYTNDSLALLYILEPSQQRIVVVEKDTGAYKHQYIAPELSTAVDLVVAQGNLYVLTNDKILNLELR